MNIPIEGFRFLFSEGQKQACLRLLELNAGPLTPKEFHNPPRTHLFERFLGTASVFIARNKTSWNHR